MDSDGAGAGAGAAIAVEVDGEFKCMFTSWIGGLAIALTLAAVLCDKWMFRWCTPCRRE